MSVFIIGMDRRVFNIHGFQSIKDVYKGSGITKTLIDELETSSKRNVGYKTVAKLCRYYGVSADYIFGFSDQPYIQDHQNIEYAINELNKIREQYLVPYTSMEKLIRQLKKKEQRELE